MRWRGRATLRHARQHPDPDPPSSMNARRRLIVALLLAAVALAFADASVVALALPDLYGEFDTTIVGVSWVLTTYALAVAIAAVPGGGRCTGACSRSISCSPAPPCLPRRRSSPVPPAASRSCSAPERRRASAPRCCSPDRCRSWSRWCRARDGVVDGGRWPPRSVPPSDRHSAGC